MAPWLDRGLCGVLWVGGVLVLFLGFWCFLFLFQSFLWGLYKPLYFLIVGCDGLLEEKERKNRRL